MGLSQHTHSEARKRTHMRYVKGPLSSDLAPPRTLPVIVSRARETPYKGACMHALRTGIWVPESVCDCEMFRHPVFLRVPFFVVCRASLSMEPPSRGGPPSPPPPTVPGTTSSLSAPAAAHAAPASGSTHDNAYLDLAWYYSFCDCVL